MVLLTNCCGLNVAFSWHGLSVMVNRAGYLDYHFGEPSGYRYDVVVQYLYET